MCDKELEDMLRSTEIGATSAPGHVAELRERMSEIAGQSGRRHGRRVTLLAAVLVVCVSGIGLSATEVGQEFIERCVWLFVRVDPVQSTQWESPDGAVWTRSVTGRDEPLAPAEQEAAADDFAHAYDAKQAGAGRLVGLIESPGFAGVTDTIYLIEYDRGDGRTNAVGSGKPTGKQAENMRIDEIMQLRDAGEGEVLSHKPLPIGMGQYVIRLTLSDGVAVDLETYFPPSTGEQRERIFTEMRQLKAELDFTVLHASFDKAQPEAGVWGTLVYRLADGRTVGASEQVPPEVISEDGAQVVMPAMNEPLSIQGAE